MKNRSCTYREQRERQFRLRCGAKHLWSTLSWGHLVMLFTVRRVNKTALCALTELTNGTVHTSRCYRGGCWRMQALHRMWWMYRLTYVAAMSLHALDRRMMQCWVDVMTGACECDRGGGPVIISVPALDTASRRSYIDHLYLPITMKI